MLHIIIELLFLNIFSCKFGGGEAPLFA